MFAQGVYLFNITAGQALRIHSRTKEMLCTLLGITGKRRTETANSPRTNVQGTRGNALQGKSRFSESVQWGSSFQ